MQEGWIIGALQIILLPYSKFDNGKQVMIDYFIKITNKFSLIIIVLLVSIYCGSTKVIDEKLHNTAIWMPPENDKYFVAVVYNPITVKGVQFSLKIRSIPDGKLLWKSDDFSSEAIYGSLDNTIFYKDSFWVTGKNFLSLQKLENDQLVEIQRKEFTAKHPYKLFLKQQACQLNRQPVYLSIAGDEYMTLQFLGENSKEWKRIEGMEFCTVALCIKENVFITDCGRKAILAGSYSKGLFTTYSLLKVQSSKRKINYSVKHNLLAVVSNSFSQNNENDYIELYDVSYSGNKPLLTKKYKIAPDNISTNVIGISPVKKYVVAVHNRENEVKIWDFNGHLLGKKSFPKGTEFDDVKFTYNGKYIVLSLRFKGYIILETKSLL
jgi:hypothetical protein